MAVGNTFGATALSSYGGFWLAFAIVLTPGGFNIVTSIETADGAGGFYNSFGLFLIVSCGSLSFMTLPLIAMLGLVHLHDNPPDLHAEIDGRLFHALFHPRHDLPPPRHRLPAS